MKKRLVCLLLTLLMLVSLVPATALTASAATLKTSEKAITVLKQLESYSGSCDANGYTGYGTRCTAKGDHGKGDEKHKITQAEADAALRKELEELDKAVNSFASKKGLTLTQQKHDAMVLFSFDNGTAWVNGTGDLQAAITSGATGSKFLNAICWWNRDPVDDQRRMVEANMYLNGVYSISKPAQFITVTLKPNGGSLSGAETRYYDTAKAEPIDAVVSNGSQIFMGWYLDKDKRDGNLVTQITQGLDDKTLYAHWQGNYNNVNSVYYQVPVSDLASKAIYKKVGGDKRNKTLQADDKDLIWIYKDFVDQKGVRWGRVSPDGEREDWVKFKTTVSGGITAGDTGLAMDVTVTVTNSYLNSRANASIFSAQVGSYKQGDKLRIINTANADGFLWGQVAKSETDNTPVCWVALMYTNYEAVKNQSGPDNSKVVAKATIRVNGYVNVRSDAGTDKQIVGALPNGTQVDLYETKYVNGIRWGRCKTGWFCLTYAEVSNLSDEGTSNDIGLTAYAFTGVMNEGGRYYGSPKVTEDSKAATAGEKVTLTNLTRDSEGNTWGKCSKGWVCISGNVNGEEGTQKDVNLDIAKYVTTANTVTIRQKPSTDEPRVSTLSKGVEFNVNDTHQIVVVGETIWGYAEKINVDGVTEGWVNLASKYVSRNGIPSLNEDGEEGTTSPTGKIATVINTDSVRVRMTGATYGQVVGSLSRGTTANVLREKDGWYELDVDVDNNPDTGSWVYGEYLDVRDGSTSGSGSSSGNSGSTGSSTVETGTGIVANTYTGVNIRTGPSTGYALVGKYLPGTQVEITEVKTGGASKWGKTEKGWVCMDYITMVSNYPIAGGSGSSSGSTGGSTSTTESAIYTGKANQEVWIRKEPDLNAEKVRVLAAGDPVTIHELLVVKTKEDGENTDSGNEGSSSTTVTTTTYWARVNDGYIYNPGDRLTLDTLDEKTYTVTENDTLNVRDNPGTEGTSVLFKLNKGDQVTVTKLKVVLGNVWGFVECNQGTGWISLRYTTPGAVTIPENKPTEPTKPTTPPIGDNGNTGDGGFVNNSGGYRYTGKVINTNELNVRATASTNSSKTTTLKSGASLVIYETTTAENMAWGRCDAGWVYLYYVDLTPCVNGAVDARVVYQDNTIAYKDVNRSESTGTYARMSVVDIYEIVGKMAKTDLGWVSTDDLLQ